MVKTYGQSNRFYCWYLNYLPTAKITTITFKIEDGGKGFWIESEKFDFAIAWD